MIMPLGGNTKGGNLRIPAAPVDRAKRDQAKGDSPKAKYMDDNTAELYNGLFMITIKDNANNYSESDMIFLLKYCLKYCKSELVRHEFEFGRQQRFHVHAIAKAKNNKMPFADGLLKYLNKYEIFKESSKDIPGGHIVARRRLSIDSLTFRLTPITDEQHLINCNGYLVKEQCDFTDNDGPDKMRDDLYLQYFNGI